MLHTAQNRVSHLIESPREGRSFPAPGVTPDTQSVQAGRQTRQANAIVILHVAIGSDRLTPPQDQMIAMDPDVQPRGPLMRTQLVIGEQNGPISACNSDPPGSQYKPPCRAA